MVPRLHAFIASKRHNNTQYIYIYIYIYIYSSCTFKNINIAHYSFTLCRLPLEIIKFDILSFDAYKRRSLALVHESSMHTVRASHSFCGRMIYCSLASMKRPVCTYHKEVRLNIYIYILFFGPCKIMTIGFIIFIRSKDGPVLIITSSIHHNI